jgi:hypothetical protein
MPRGTPENLNLAIFNTLQDILIVQLAKSGVSQQESRALLGVDIVRVNRVARLLSRKSKTERIENGWTKNRMPGSLS